MLSLHDGFGAETQRFRPIVQLSLVPLCESAQTDAIWGSKSVMDSLGTGKVAVWSGKG
jgi:hypothetical protein